MGELFLSALKSLSHQFLNRNQDTGSKNRMSKYPKGKKGRKLKSVDSNTATINHNQEVIVEWLQYLCFFHVGISRTCDCNINDIEIICMKCVISQPDIRQAMRISSPLEPGTHFTPGDKTCSLPSRPL